MSEPEIVVVADDDIAAVEAAARIAASLVDAVARRGRVDWVTTGGSALAARYRRMAEPPLVDAIPWDSVHVRVWQDGVEALDRHFRAPRRGEADLLAEAIETGGRDPISLGALRAAAALIGPDGVTS